MNRFATDMIAARSPRQCADIILNWLNTASDDDATPESLLAEAVDLLTATKNTLYELTQDRSKDELKEAA